MDLKSKAIEELGSDLFDSYEECKNFCSTFSDLINKNTHNTAIAATFANYKLNGLTLFQIAVKERCWKVVELLIAKIAPEEIPRLATQKIIEESGLINNILEYMVKTHAPWTLVNKIIIKGKLNVNNLTSVAKAIILIYHIVDPLINLIENHEMSESNISELLKFAIKFNKTDAARYLINMGAKVDENNLLNACSHANDTLILLLIRKGVKVNNDHIRIAENENVDQIIIDEMKKHIN